MTTFIALVSGKGGVGKTTSTLNVGQALVNLGNDIVIVDANIATPNIAIQLGFMNPEGTLNKFLRKEKNLTEITYMHESGLSIIPSSPSYDEFQKTNPQKLHEIFEHLDDTAEFVLVDSPSGLGYEVHQVLKNTDEAIIVVNPNMSSLVDALKTIQLARASNNVITGVILNRVNKGKHELSISEVESILGYHVLAEVKECKKVRNSVHKNMPLNYLYPRSKSAKEFAKVAKHLALDHKKMII